MNTLELVSFVKAKVKDDSFSDADILALLNEGLFRVAHDLCLPELQTTEDLSFDFGDDPFTELSDDYHHDLWMVANLSEPSRPIKLHTSVHSLQRIYLRDDVAGTIKDAALDGVVLHVRPAPNPGQLLRVWYYRKPEVLELSADSIPEAIPFHLHTTALAYYAIAKIYDEIEDGVDGNKTNTTNWETKWMRDGFNALAETKGVKRAARSTPYVKRHPRWF